MQKPAMQSSQLTVYKSFYLGGELLVIRSYDEMPNLVQIDFQCPQTQHKILEEYHQRNEQSQCCFTS